MKEKFIVEHKTGGYQVQIWNNNKLNYVGIYSTIEQAILERDNYLKKYNIKPKYQNMYFDKRIAYKEMLISQAEGRLSPKLFDMLIKIVKGVNRKFRYKEEEDRYDVMVYSYEVIIKNWYHFDTERYDNVLAWTTEIVKRAHALQFKQLQKSRINTISLDYRNEKGDFIMNI